MRFAFANLDSRTTRSQLAPPFLQPCAAHIPELSRVCGSTPPPQTRSAGPHTTPQATIPCEAREGGAAGRPSDRGRDRCDWAAVRQPGLPGDIRTHTDAEPRQRSSAAILLSSFLIEFAIRTRRGLAARCPPVPRLLTTPTPHTSSLQPNVGQSIRRIVVAVVVAIAIAVVVVSHSPRGGPPPGVCVCLWLADGRPCSFRWCLCVYELGRSQPRTGIDRVEGPRRRRPLFVSRLVVVVMSFRLLERFWPGATRYTPMRKAHTHTHSTMVA